MILQRNYFGKFSYFCTMAWFETWFDTPYYHILYNDRNYEEAENFINLLVKELQLSPPAKIIDLACGKGRHSIFLNKMGFEVLGVDLSKQSIFHNKEFENPTLKFGVHDMRNPIIPLVSAEKVDAVFNLFTSFGYFEDPEDDKKVFRSISESLNDDGFFVLDFLNAKWVENTLVPTEKFTKGGIDFHIKKKIEDEHVIKDIVFSQNGKEFHFFEKVKLHTLEKIGEYAAEFGFERQAVFGDYHLNDFEENTSPRCINIFKKKKGFNQD